MKKWINKLLNNSIIKALVLVVGGTVIAQIINFLLQPVIARLYTPEQFGMFGIFSSGVSILIILITFSYEQSVIIAKTENSAQRLFFGTIYVGIIVVIIITVLIIAGKNVILSALGMENGDWIFLLPISAGIYGLYNLTVAYNYRLERHKNIAQSSIVRVLALGILQCLLFFVGIGHMGLIIGYVLSMFFGCLCLIRNILRSGLDRDNARLSCVLPEMAKYKSFPLYQMPTDFINHFTSEVTVFAIKIVYTTEAVGIYSLINRILSFPITLISEALRQIVIRQLSVSDMKPEHMKKYMFKITGIMLAIWILPLIILSLWGENIFVLFFGGTWKGIGKYINAMVFLYCIRFIAYPLTGIAVLNKRQEKLLIFQIIQMCIVIGSAVIASVLGWSVYRYLFIQSSLVAVVYILQGITCIQMIQKKE